jgi:hypothetical protein
MLERHFASIYRMTNGIPSIQTAHICAGRQLGFPPRLQKNSRMQQVVLEFGRISGTLCSTKAEVTSGEPALEEDSLEAITTPQTLKQSCLGISYDSLESLILRDTTNSQQITDCAPLLNFFYNSDFIIDSLFPSWRNVLQQCISSIDTI